MRSSLKRIASGCRHNFLSVVDDGLACRANVWKFTFRNEPRRFFSFMKHNCDCIIRVTEKRHGKRQKKKKEVGRASKQNQHCLIQIGLMLVGLMQMRTPNYQKHALVRSRMIFKVPFDKISALRSGKSSNQTRPAPRTQSCGLCVGSASNSDDL